MAAPAEGKIAPSRMDLIHRWIAEAFRRVGVALRATAPPTGPVPLTRILEAFHITLQPVPGLTRGKAREFLRLSAVEERLAESEKSPLAGLMVTRPAGSVVLVNAQDILTRRRFTVAHELGHHLLHQPRNQQGILRYDLTAEDGGNLSGEELGRIEAEAHAFAANLLMPESWVRAWFAQQGNGTVISPGLAASRLATLLLVSRQATIRRLADLGLTADATEDAASEEAGDGDA